MEEYRVEKSEAINSMSFTEMFKVVFRIRIAMRIASEINGDSKWTGNIRGENHSLLLDVNSSKVEKYWTNYKIMSITIYSPNENKKLQFVLIC